MRTEEPENQTTRCQFSVLWFPGSSVVDPELLAEIVLDQLLERGEHRFSIRPFGTNTNLVALASGDVEQANRRYRNLFRGRAAQVLDSYLALELADFVDKILGRARVQSILV